MSKAAVHQITDAIPPEAICDRLNVKHRSIRLARERGCFPASWFREMKDLCREHGVECPDDVFNWKSPSSDAPSAGAS